MSTPLGSMHVELGLDSSQFASSLNASKRAVQYFSREAKALDGVMKNSGTTITALSAKQKSLQSAFERQGQVLKTLKENFDKLDATERGSARWERAASEIEKENIKLEQLRGELGKVSTALKQVQQENSFWGKAGAGITGFGNKIEGLGNWFKKAGNHLQEMGNAMQPVSTLLSAGFALATKKAVDFGGEMQVTKSLLSDTVGTAEELNQATNLLGDNSKKWAKQYGISTSQINTGMQELIKGGLDANQTIGAMPPILNATKATGEDFNTVMNASTSIMSQFGLTSADTATMLTNTQRVTDSLSFVANKTKAGFADMGLAMEYVGPVAHSVNMEIEETAAAIGILSDAGIDGQKAGTALRGALSKLLDPSKENAAAFEKLGFSAEEFKSGAIKLPDVLDRIRQNTEGMTEAQRAALIAQAFGIEAQSGMNTLVSRGGDELRKLTEETKNAEGYTESLAKKMSGSAKSNVEKFKSTLEVLQINIGQKLLPHLTKLIDGASDVIDWFDNLDESTQNLIITTAGLIAIGYPALNILGNATSLFGTLVGGTGKAVSSLGGLVSWFGKLGGATSAATTIAGTTTAMQGATAASGVLAGGLSLATLGWGALAVAGVAAVGTVAYFAQQALDARQRTEEWGAAVSKAEAEELSRFKDKVDETTKVMDSFGTEGVQDVEAVKNAFSELTGEINKLVDENLAKDLELAKKLGLSDEEIQRIKSRSDETKTTVNGMAEDVINIYKRANDQRRQLSAEEREIVLSAQNALIQEQLEQLKVSGKDKEAITKAMNGRIEELNAAQLTKALSTTKKWIEDENKAYQSRKDEIQRLFDEGKLAQETYNREMEQLEAEHAAKMDTYGEKYMALQKRLLEVNGSMAKSSPEAQKLILGHVQETMEKLGLSYEEFQSKMEGVAGEASNTSTLVAGYWQGMSEEARSAVNYWNGIVLDPITGEIKTNAQEEIQNALKAEGGWEAMKLSLKEGRLTTTAKIAVGEALVATGQWNNLSPTDKALVVDGQPAIKAIVESEENLAIWNSMPESVKKLLAENEQFMSNAQTAQTALTNWNALQPFQKDLIANDLASGNAERVNTAINSIVQTSIPTISATDGTAPAVSSANTNVNSPKQNAPIEMFGLNSTQPAVAQTQASVNSPKQIAPIQMFGLDSTQTAVAQTQASVNSPKQLAPIQLNALNSTSGAVAQASQAVNSVRQYSPTSINASDNATWQANQVANAIHAIPSYKLITIEAARRGEAGFYATGTDFHPGGLAMVNDQRGPLYRELVTLPTGESFIPEGRDVVLPLPRGSKVLPAKETRDLMKRRGIPKYAEGVGYSKNSKMYQSLDNFVKKTNNQIIVRAENSATIQALREILSVLKQKMTLNQDVTVNVSGGAETNYRRLAEEVGMILAQELQRKAQLKGG
ncbi:TPA: phage tail tape measure protein [Streptococcus suis]